MIIDKEMILVSRKATAEMIEAAWAQALDEDADGVWDAMVTAWDKLRQQTENAFR
jgi:hypothetical protein